MLIKAVLRTSHGALPSSHESLVLGLPAPPETKGEKKEGNAGTCVPGL